ncbi:MAG: hypothetical protein H9W81_07610 [Enterococcus sp.]|nr:hypothetical protein [Enterococcus sp.]
MDATRYRLEYTGYLINAFVLPLALLVVLGFTGDLFGPVGVLAFIAGVCWSVWLYHLRPRHYRFPFSK